MNVYFENSQFANVFFDLKKNIYINIANHTVKLSEIVKIVFIFLRCYGASKRVLK